MLAANPDSYLAVTRSIEDLDPTLDVTVEKLLAMCRASLDRLVDAGAFDAERDAQFFVYQLTSGRHLQTGLVGGVATADFVTGKVHVHEQVHHRRAAHLARHLAVVGVQSSPIAVAHKPISGVRDILATSMDGQQPILELEAEPGFVQRIWPVDPAHSAPLVAELRDQPLYLIDGHHRGAASIEYRRLVGPGNADMTLCALFPTDELANFAFHRVLPATIGSQSTVDALTTVDARSIDRPTEVIVANGEIALFDGRSQRWWAIAAPSVGDVAPSLADLAPTRLADRFDTAFGAFPANGIEGHSWRDLIRYRPGVLPLDQLTAEAVERNDVLFMLPALSIDELIDVADAGLAMPPKSTYFDPKVRSGIFLRHL